jgi:histone acetyltransferase
MEHKLETKLYSDIDAFITDAHLVFDNCLLYNPEDSPYAKCARRLAKFFGDMVAEDREKIKFED